VSTVPATGRHPSPKGHSKVGLISTMASSAVHHLDFCQAVLGSDRAISAILGVSPSQVSRWRKGQLPDPDNADRLAGLSLVVEMLARWLDPGVVGGWLYGVHAHLGDRSPAYMIGEGLVAEVIGVIEAEKAGVHA